MRGERGKELLRRRGEKLERPFAHQFETGGMRRLRVRGLEQVRKKLLVQATACNLALLLRTKYGAGTPRGLAEAAQRLGVAILGLLAALLGPTRPDRRTERPIRPRPGIPGPAARTPAVRAPKSRFRHRLLGHDGISISYKSGWNPAILRQPTGSTKNKVPLLDCKTLRL